MHDVFSGRRWGVVLDTPGGFLHLSCLVGIQGWRVGESISGDTDVDEYPPGDDTPIYLSLISSKRAALLHGA